MMTGFPEEATTIATRPRLRAEKDAIGINRLSFVAVEWRSMRFSRRRPRKTSTTPQRRQVVATSARRLAVTLAVRDAPRRVLTVYELW